MFFARKNTRMVFGLVVILFALSSFAGNFITDADAAKAGGTKSPKFGSNTAHIVCGDKLCSEIGDQTKQKTKYVEKPLPKVPDVSTSETETQHSTDNSLEEKAHADHKIIQLNIARANLPVTIPMHEGYYNGEFVYYIITDSSDAEISKNISKTQLWKVNTAPALLNSPADSLSKAYVFTNGVNGDGALGFQGEVFSATPAQPNDYNSLVKPVFATWFFEGNSKILLSEKEITQQAKQKKITLQEQPYVINMPQIVWPDGQIPVKKDKTVDDKTPFVGGQIIGINIDKSQETDNSSVTFISHRAWGPDGRTVYFIVTGSFPTTSADALFVPSIQKAYSMIGSTSVNDVYHFLNGIDGIGPWDAQPGIFSVIPTDIDYSPIFQVQTIYWNDLESAAILETIRDIEAYQDEGLIEVKPSALMGVKHIVNAPIVDPFQ